MSEKNKKTYTKKKNNFKLKRKNKNTKRTTRVLKRIKIHGGIQPDSRTQHKMRKHVKAVAYDSNITPGKPFYKVFVFDQPNNNMAQALNDYIKKTVDETEEDLVSMRKNYNINSKKERDPKEVTVYGFEIIQKV